MKRADAEKFRHHQVDSQGLAHAPQDGWHVIRPGSWRGHSCCGDFGQEGCLVKNKSGELKVGVDDLALHIFEETKHAMISVGHG